MSLAGKTFNLKSSLSVPPDSTYQYSYGDLIKDANYPIVTWFTDANDTQYYLIFIMYNEYLPNSLTIRIGSVADPYNYIIAYQNGAWTNDAYKKLTFVESDSLFFSVNNTCFLDESIFENWLSDNREPTVCLTSDLELESVANAIRTKSGTSDPLVYPTGFISAIQNIPTGGGGGGSSDGDVIFIDYDGSIVASKTKAEINAMASDSDLPASPSHTGLIAQGWNWTVTQLKAQLTAMPDQKVYVGQMYITASGNTEIDVEMPYGRLDPILTIAVNGEISVDWGDETTPDTVTGTSESVRLEVPHSYANAGSYTITVSVASGSFCFYGSSSYTLLRKNATANENKVYSNCIRQIRLGNGITRIRSYAFLNCLSLASITIPSSVTSIENNAFNSCSSLASITIPIGVTSIDNSAFSYCYSLASITIPSSVTSIDDSAFTACYPLSSITIPSGVTSIGNSAFSSCSSLASITIPNGVTSIGNSAFQYCYSLSGFTIPSGVTSIGNSVFSNCQSLASITIPSSVTSIGYSAFFNCHSLTSITIPSSVTSIGNTAFSGCYGTSEYHLPTTVPTGGTNMFNYIVSDCVIYVPQGTLSAYQSATNWATYASYMEEEDVEEEEPA